MPLGLRLDPENLHGLANGTGGAVLRTMVGSEKLDDVMKRYFAAFTAPILYDAKLTLPRDGQDRAANNTQPNQ